MTTPSNRPIRLFALFALCFLIVLVLVFFYVWEYTQMTELRYRLEKSQKELEHLQAVNKELRLKVLSAESLAKVEREAAQLGMSSPDKGQMVVLPDPAVLKGGQLLR